MKFKVDKTEIVKLLDNNKDMFENNGGDTKNLLDKCKVSHAQRVFGSKKKKKLLDSEDLKNGFETFIKSKNKVKNIMVRCIKGVFNYFNSLIIKYN